MSKCRNILRAYARRNPDLGYCQGLNFIAWEICRRDFTEEEAFWFFVALVENILPLDYYSSLEGVLVDQRIFTCLIEIILPEIAKKLKECNLDCSAFSIPWFVCVFSRTLNAKLFQIAMDNVVIQGSLALFKIGLAVLKLMDGQILNAPDFPHLLRIIEEKSRKLNDPLKFQELINQIYISKRAINLARIMFCNLIEEENYRNNQKHHKFSQRNTAHNQEKLKESMKNCNPSELVCLALIETNKLNKKNYIFFNFRQNSKLTMIFHDYLEELHSKNHKGYQISHKTHKHEITKEDRILVGRHVHICQGSTDNKLKHAEKKLKIPISTNNDNGGILQNLIVQSVKDSRDSVPRKKTEKTNSIAVNQLAKPTYNYFFSRNYSISVTPLSGENGKASLKSPKQESFELLAKSSLGKTSQKPENEEFLPSEFFLNSEEKLSQISGNSAVMTPRSGKITPPFIAPLKESVKLEHSVIMLDDCLETSKSEENIEEILDNFDPENFNPRESILLLKNKKVLPNMNKDVLEKYYPEIEHSESFEFVNKFFAYDIVKK